MAVWGGAGLAVAHGHDRLQQGFHQALWNAPSGSARLGELVEAGYFNLWERGGCCQDVRFSYLLLGDPLTTIHVGSAQAGPTETPVITPTITPTNTLVPTSTVIAPTPVVTPIATPTAPTLHVVSPEESTAISATVGMLDVETDFPSGAVAEAVTITLQITSSPPPISHALHLVGPALTIAPLADEQTDDVELLKPMQLTVGYDLATVQRAEEGSLSLYYWEPIPGIWHKLPTTQNTLNRTLEAKLEQLGTVAVMGDARDLVFLPLLMR